MRVIILCSLLFISDLALSQVINLGKGRELFIDDRIVGETTLTRVVYNPTYYHQNPVLKADKKWEFNSKGDPYAAPFSGGVWFDEADSRFKMWYSAGGGKKDGLVTCYAESRDGKNWIKPVLDIVPQTNIVDTTEHDCVSVLLDKFESDSSKRYKMFLVVFNSPASVSMKLKYSPDGTHWSKTMALSGELHDRCAVYYDPFKKEYVLSLKTIGEYRRSRNYLSHKDPELLVSLAHRTFDKKSDKFIKYWFNAEDDDPRHPQFPEIRPQIYNHEAMAYEGLTLGYFTVWQGPENDVCDSLKIQKRNEVLIGWSRDGFHWNRENKKVFFPVSAKKDAWNAANIQSANGSPIIMGDSLYFYMSGRYDIPEWDSNFSTGLATMRRDGFASLKSHSNADYLLTKDVSFDGNYLFVNANIPPKGSLRAEILDVHGKVLKDFSEAECVPMKENSTKYRIRWKNGKTLRSVKNSPVRLKFYLSKGAELYSFWISEWELGESKGYTAGGGPGLSATGMDIK